MAGFADVEIWTAADGARLALRSRPAEGARRGTAVFVHGWGDHTGRWGHVADWFAGRGIAFYAADQRGHGRTPGRRGHVERFAQYLSDLGALRRRAAAEAPGPQVLLGHSFGGFIVLRYLETAPPGVAGAIAAAPFVHFFERPAAWKVMLARLLGDVIPSLPIATGLAYDLISRDPEVVRAFREDPYCHQVMTPRAYREAMAAVKVLHAEAGRIGVPLLFELAEEDRIVSTPAAAAFAQSLKGDVTVKRYPGMYHNLFHEPDRERVFADLEPWLERVLPAS